MSYKEPHETKKETKKICKITRKVVAIDRGGFTPRARGAAARGGAQKYKEQLFNEQPKTTRIVLLLVYGCMIFSGRDYLAPPGDSSLDPPLVQSDDVPVNMHGDCTSFY